MAHPAGVPRGGGWVAHTPALDGSARATHDHAGSPAAVRSPTVWRLVRPTTDLSRLLAWLDERGLRERALKHELGNASEALQSDADLHEQWLQVRQARAEAPPSVEDENEVPAEFFDGTS